ncbi:DUF2530 domain-containing protein [Isoptericola sp. S6320L]|uniref:DUF2530 domain-containing protein n=1 Tax=Isoptericola sp. S6320L TaxID=2926411 RepID=UPI001FF1365E|nr:DUF2530 domain-containing protein [Isoptericola sp. S6320L]MCK0116303.1 DUF2530 domain-containing protein [Isoptericola sp. S6320L]
MPTVMSLLLHPERRRPTPPPERVDLRRVILLGIIVWSVALVVLSILALAGQPTGGAVAVCLAGIALGGIGLLWARRHRDDPAD